MLPQLPLNFLHSHLHCFRPTPSRTKIRRERAPPPNGTLPTPALSAGSRPTCRVEKALPSSGNTEARRPEPLKTTRSA